MARFTVACVCQIVMDGGVVFLSCTVVTLANSFLFFIQEV